MFFLTFSFFFLCFFFLSLYFSFTSLSTNIWVFSSFSLSTRTTTANTSSYTTNNTTTISGLPLPLSLLIWKVLSAVQNFRAIQKYLPSVILSDNFQEYRHRRFLYFLLSASFQRQNRICFVVGCCGFFLSFVRLLRVIHYSCSASSFTCNCYLAVCASVDSMNPEPKSNDLRPSSWFGVKSTENRTTLGKSFSRDFSMIFAALNNLSQ